MTLKELVGKLSQLENSPYRNIFTFTNEEEEKEFNQELDIRIEQEADEVIKKYQQAKQAKR